MSVTGNYFNRPLFRYRGADVISLLNLCSVNESEKNRILCGAEISVVSATFTRGHAAVALSVAGRAGYVLLVLDDVPLSLRGGPAGLDLAAAFLQSLGSSGSFAAPPLPGMLVTGDPQCGVKCAEFFQSSTLSAQRLDQLFLLVVNEVGDVDLWCYRVDDYTWALVSAFTLNYEGRSLSDYCIHSVAVEPTASMVLWAVGAGTESGPVRVLSTHLSAGTDAVLTASPPAELLREALVVSMHACPNGVWIACTDCVYYFQPSFRRVVGAAVVGDRVVAASLNACPGAAGALHVLTDGGALLLCDKGRDFVLFKEIVRFSCCADLSQDDVGMLVWGEFLLVWRNEQQLAVRLETVMHQLREKIVFPDSTHRNAINELHASLSDMFGPASEALSIAEPACRFSICSGDASVLYMWSSRHVVEAGPCLNFFMELLSTRPVCTTARSGEAATIICVPSMAMLRKVSMTKQCRAQTDKLEGFWETGPVKPPPSATLLDVTQGNSLIKLEKQISADLYVPHTALSVANCSCVAALFIKLVRRRVPTQTESVLSWLNPTTVQWSECAILKLLTNPPLSYPMVAVSEWVHENDILRIATEEAYKYISLKNKIIETSTWKSSSRYDYSVVDIESVNCLEKIVSFYFEKFPLFLYDVVRGLECVRGGWRGDTQAAESESLLGYMPKRHCYFGESDRDDDDNDDDNDEEGDEDLDEGGGEEVSWRGLLRLKSPYIDRIFKIVDVENQIISFEQKNAVVKLLCWGAHFGRVAALLIAWSFDDDLILLNSALHQYYHGAVDSVTCHPIIFERMKKEHRSVYDKALHYFLDKSDIPRLRALCIDEPHIAQPQLSHTLSDCIESRTGSLSNIVSVSGFRSSEFFLL